MTSLYFSMLWLTNSFHVPNIPNEHDFLSFSKFFLLSHASINLLMTFFSLCHFLLFNYPSITDSFCPSFNMSINCLSLWSHLWSLLLETSIETNHFLCYLNFLKELTIFCLILPIGIHYIHLISLQSGQFIPWLPISHKDFNQNGHNEMEWAQAMLGLWIRAMNTDSVGLKLLGVKVEWGKQDSKI